MLKEVKRNIAELRTDRKRLHQFGLLFSVILFIFSFYNWWKGENIWLLFLMLSLGFLIISFFLPSALKGFYRSWMILSFVLGWIMTRVILTIIFFAIITPIGLFLRLIGKDLLNTKTDSNTESYWQDHEKISDRERYKKQF